MIDEFEDVILGGGKGGKSLAMALANAGHKVALIERGQIGGTCINVACIPTKTMVASAKVIEFSKQAKDFGVDLQPAASSLATVIERKRRVVQGMVDTHWKLFTGTPNMDFLVGVGKFVGPKTIEIALADGGIKVVRGQRVYINTGSQTTIPKIDGLDKVPYLTSTSIMELQTLPSHLAIIGGGYIALEFAQIFVRLGSKVTVILRGNRFLPREDADIAAEVRKVLEEDGVQFLDDAATESVVNAGDGIELKYTQAGASHVLRTSHVMVAIGRTANTENLGLEAAGVEVGKGGIKVNEKLETTAPGVWAIGDCNGGPLFTHVSWDDYRIIKDNVLYNAGRTTTDRLIPYTLFIDPELGRVGLTEEEARARGYNIAVAKLPANKVPRANTAGETKGLLKAVIDKDTKQILGCSLFCHSGGEVMSVVQMAMLGKLPYTAVRDTIFTHPTMAESLNLLLAAF